MRGPDPADCRTLPARTGGIAHNLETGNARLRQHARHMVPKNPWAGRRGRLETSPDRGHSPAGFCCWRGLRSLLCLSSPPAKREERTVFEVKRFAMGVDLA